MKHKVMKWLSVLTIISGLPYFLIAVGSEESSGQMLSAGLIVVVTGFAVLTASLLKAGWLAAITFTLGAGIIAMGLPLLFDPSSLFPGYAWQWQRVGLPQGGAMFGAGVFLMLAPRWEERYGETFWFKGFRGISLFVAFSTAGLTVAVIILSLVVALIVIGVLVAILFTSVAAPSFEERVIGLLEGIVARLKP